MKKEFEICARGIIIQKGKILICKVKNKRNWFFPGGHVEFGEKADITLKRELKEEIGASVKNMKFIGTSENLYQQWGKNLHEISIVFQANLDKKQSKALEDHMEFKWADLRYLHKMEVLPEALKKSILKWLKDKKIFWSSQGFKK